MPNAQSQDSRTLRPADAAAEKGAAAGRIGCRKDRLPEGSEWLYELKLDGYRALAMKRGGKIRPRSRNDNDFNLRYPGIVEALADMPDETVIDGEIVALDEGGRPSFISLQNYGSTGARLRFFIFDVLILNGKDVMGDPLMKRRELIEEHVLPMLADPIRFPGPGRDS
jgi:bifunctional non-homologous end joining protein LigD